MAKQYFTGIPNDIFDQLIMRDFTKRQLKILLQIMRGSFGFHKAGAFVPKLELFEYAGISSRVVSKEIKTLVEMNVLIRDMVSKEYAINPDFQSWNIKLPSEVAKLCREEYLKCNARHRSGIYQRGSNPHDRVRALHVSTYEPYPSGHQQVIDSGPQNIGNLTNRTWLESPTKHSSIVPENPSLSGNAREVRATEKKDPRKGNIKETSTSFHHPPFTDDPFVKAAMEEDQAYE